MRIQPSFGQATLVRSRTRGQQGSVSCDIKRREQETAQVLAEAESLTGVPSCAVYLHGVWFVLPQADLNRFKMAAEASEDGYRALMESTPGDDDGEIDTDPDCYFRELLQQVIRHFID